MPNTSAKCNLPGNLPMSVLLASFDSREESGDSERLGHSSVTQPHYMAKMELDPSTFLVLNPRTLLSYFLQ